MKNYLIVGGVCLVIGAVASRLLFKVPAEIKTQTVEIVKVKENVKVVKETRPDGTIVETKEITTEKDNSKFVKNEKKNSAPKWLITVNKDLLNDSQWGGSVGRAIFDNVYISGNCRTGNVFGVGISVAF
jgi:hypothetical protein